MDIIKIAFNETVGVKNFGAQLGGFGGVAGGLVESKHPCLKTNTGNATDRFVV